MKKYTNIKIKVNNNNNIDETFIEHTIIVEKNTSNKNINADSKSNINYIIIQTL